MTIHQFSAVYLLLISSDKLRLWKIVASINSKIKFKTHVRTYASYFPFIKSTYKGLFGLGLSVVENTCAKVPHNMIALINFVNFILYTCNCEISWKTVNQFFWQCFESLFSLVKSTSLIWDMTDVKRLLIHLSYLKDLSADKL